MKKMFSVHKGNPYLRGTFFEKNQITISVSLNSSNECGIILYLPDKENNITIPFPKEYCNGKQYSIILKDLPSDILDYSYLFYVDETLILDPYARRIVQENGIDKGAFYPMDSYSWGLDEKPNNLYSESIYYGLHIKGFTKHPTSGVKEAGTFLGATKKLSYLLDLGITGVVLQPVNDFPEEIKVMITGKHKVNYWGYVTGNYFALAKRYAFKQDEIKEFKDFVKEYHKRKIEIILQFYFDESIQNQFIIDVLHFWVVEYHIDGFELFGTGLPMQEILEDSLLSKTKIWNVDVYEKCPDSLIPESQKNAAGISIEFMNTMRRFLKGDEDMLRSFLALTRKNPGGYAQINYLADFNTMRVSDFVSYERKHNEANGENNQDGDKYNFSWNCGIEGETKKRAIQSLRTKQMKNAMCFLLLAQGTPYLFMGDEIGDTAFGNNNPYCQDNETSWLNWDYKKKNKEYTRFVKNLILLRKNHSILHYPVSMRIMDYHGFGYPDVSYHAQEVWRPSLDSFSRNIGIMYCGMYSKIIKKEEDNFFYMAYNMHWENHKFSLPKLPKQMKWKLLFDTGKKMEEKEYDSNADVPERTVAVFYSEQEI